MRQCPPARLINGAKRPVLMLGLLASERNAAQAIRELVAGTKIPVVCTYQGAGVVSRELLDHFGGRVGLSIPNQRISCSMRPI